MKRDAKRSRLSSPHTPRATCPAGCPEQDAALRWACEGRTQGTSTRASCAHRAARSPADSRSRRPALPGQRVRPAPSGGHVAVRLRVRIERAAAGKAPAVDTVAVANSGFEAGAQKSFFPSALPERLGLWPPPRGARAERFDSPAATFSMVTVARAVRVGLAGAR